jgi:hypothetical protein
MRRDMRARLPTRGVSIAANEADYVAFLEVVRAEEFDAARAREIMETQLGRARAFQKLGRELSIERIGKMSFEGRSAYADRLQERLEGRKKRRPRKER